MAKYHNLSDEERERYNLPPSGFQGNEMTVVIQGPTKEAMTHKVKAFSKFATSEGLTDIRVLDESKDPDGGYKAIVEAHNFNPVTWASEQYHRAKLGVQHGAEQGRKKAEIKHAVSQAAELAATHAREMAIQQARVARIKAAAPIRIETEEEAGRLMEEQRRVRRLSSLSGERARQPVDVNAYIFGTEIP